MSRRSRFSMINPTDGPRVGAWRRAALGFCLAAALSATGVTAAQAATLEGQQFRELHAQFLTLNAMVFGVSRDSLPRHDRFRLFRRRAGRI